MSPISLFFLILALQCCAISGKYFKVKYFDSEITIDAATCRDQTCTNGELSCSQNCTSVQTCVNGNQVCDTLVCGDGTYCGSDSLRCDQSQPVCSSPSSTLQCMEEGVFPNPNNCNQYYCCNGVNNPQTVTPLSCPAGTYYDYRYSLCTTTGSCANLPKCLSGVDHTQCDILPDNNYLSYICMSNSAGGYTPVFFACPTGRYDNTNCACRNTSTSVSGPKSNILRNIEAVTCSAPDNSSTSTSTTSTTTPSSVITCTSPYDFFAIPNDNCHYCYCLPSLRCDIRDCLAGTYFNADLGRCVVGTCTIT